MACSDNATLAACPDEYQLAGSLNTLCKKRPGFVKGSMSSMLRGQKGSSEDQIWL